MDAGELKVLTRILGLKGQEVVDASIDEAEGRIDLTLAEPQGPYVCPECGAEHASAHDKRRRVVRDIPWAELEVYVHFTLVRVRCCKGQTPIAVPPEGFIKKNTGTRKGFGS